MESRPVILISTQFAQAKVFELHSFIHNITRTWYAIRSLKKLPLQMYPSYLVKEMRCNGWIKLENIIFLILKKAEDTTILLQSTKGADQRIFLGGLAPKALHRLSYRGQLKGRIELRRVWWSQNSKPVGAEIIHLPLPSHLHMLSVPPLPRLLYFFISSFHSIFSPITENSRKVLSSQNYMTLQSCIKVYLQLGNQAQ